MKPLTTNCSCSGITLSFSFFLGNTFPKMPVSQPRFPFHPASFMPSVSGLTACTSRSGSHVLLPGLLAFWLLLPCCALSPGLVKHSPCVKCHPPDDISVITYRNVLGCFGARRPPKVPPSTLLLYFSPLVRLLLPAFPPSVSLSAPLLIALVFPFWISSVSPRRLLCTTFCFKAFLKLFTFSFLLRSWV